MHGVSWHVMDSGIDAGEILASREVLILPGDSAYSLNLRCYESAIDAFAELVGRLDAGAVMGKPQTGKRSYCGMKDKPFALGIVTSDYSAPEVSRLFRSTNFGPTDNPVCLPKVIMRNQAYLLS